MQNSLRFSFFLSGSEQEPFLLFNWCDKQTLYSSFRAYKDIFMFRNMLWLWWQGPSITLGSRHGFGSELHSSNHELQQNLVCSFDTIEEGTLPI